MQLSSRTRVLFVDDILDEIQIYMTALEADGASVSACSSSADAKKLIEAGDFDVAVIDANFLPSSKIALLKEQLRATGLEQNVDEEGEGFRLVSWIQQNAPEVGTVVLTAERLTAEDEVTGLSLGADLYLRKGVSQPVFCSSIKSLVRRLFPFRTQFSRFGELRLDLDAATLENSTGHRIRLTEAETILLREVLSKSPKTCTRAQLYRTIFGRDLPSKNDRAVDNIVSRLRKKSSSKLLTELPVETRYGGGYSFSG
ncbi:winged helix-turn-helix domain-containing protein [uncultured Roseobacter sp.]|uniref:response regulator transcription factor n=1 Tax=uncultured Roseobacter sp. TaxID=114847 RepID=UPI0026314BE5|nr:winged helix-turn-helix domain-containing protein [uncultured Roseobacter sp.]